MMNKILSVIIVIAMVSFVTVGVSAESAEVFPNYYTDGDLTIGFFNFVDGRGTHLDVRLEIEVRPLEVPFKAEIYQHYTLDGITRIRDMHINDDWLYGPFADNSGSENEIAFTMIALENYEPEEWVIDTISYARVDGTGTVTFGESSFRFIFADGTEKHYDLSGVTISNAQIGYVSPVTETTPPATSEAEATTTTVITDEDEDNPNTGVTFMLIPAIAAVGIALINRRRK
jgi:hypothetical protein